MTSVDPKEPTNAIFTTRRVFAAIVVYCLAHYLIRLNLSPVFSLDEAEQLLFAQHLDWGYRFRHPPLITWIYASVDAIGMLSRDAFFLIKYAIMAAGFMAFHLGARRILGDGAWAAAATASWASVYVLAWWPHVDLMHTVLLFTLLCASFHAGVLALTRGGWSDWLYFGATIGLGFLSKYIHIVFPAALLIAALSLPDWRSKILSLKAFGGLVTALAIIAPYGIWAATYGYSLTELTGDVVTQTGQSSGIGGALQGAVSFSLSGLEFIALFFPLAALVWPRAFWPPANAQSSHSETAALTALLWRTTWIGLALTATPILFSGATAFKSRWMHQALLLAPLLVLARAQVLDDGGRRLKIWGGVCVALIAAIMIARPVVWSAKPASGEGKMREYQPFNSFAEGLRSADFQGGTIVARDYILAGNLAHFLPEARIVDASFPLHIYPDPSGDGSCLLVWRKDADLAPLEAFVRSDMDTNPSISERQGRVTSSMITPAEGLVRLNYRFVPSSEECR